MSNEMTPEQFDKFKEAMKQTEDIPTQAGVEFNPKAGQIELDWPKATIHLQNVEANLLKYAGKQDHNPYIMMNELNIPKLKRGCELKRAECFDAIMALPLDVVPHIDNLKTLQS